MILRNGGGVDLGESGGDRLEGVKEGEAVLDVLKTKRQKYTLDYLSCHKQLDLMAKNK